MTTTQKMNDVPDATDEPIVFVGLGSNLGDRLGHLRFAVRALREDPEIDVLGVAPVYESPAHVVRSSDAQPDFLNSVVALSTSLEPRALLRTLQRVESAAGRSGEGDHRWSARTLDLDLLIFGGGVIRSGDLKVPHPRLGGRRFVLQPLADLDPDRHVPDPYGKTVRQLLAECPDTDQPVRTPFKL